MNQDVFKNIGTNDYQIIEPLKNNFEAINNQMSK